MPIHMRWLNSPKNVLLFDYQEPLTLDEIMESQKLTLYFLDSADQPVMSIIDMTGLTRLPQRLLSSFPKLGSHPVLGHPNNGQTIMISRNRTVAHFGDIFSSIYKRIQIVPDWPTALAQVYRSIDSAGQR
ncbi:MAG: hypothetical protein GYB68_06200 [Chloroflexi bacterium]|nr:hypothetical protein [Chloroflexota bacterium]